MIGCMAVSHYDWLWLSAPSLFCTWASRPPTWTARHTLKKILKQQFHLLIALAWMSASTAIGRKYLSPGDIDSEMFNEYDCSVNSGELSFMSKTLTSMRCTFIGLLKTACILKEHCAVFGQSSSLFILSSTKRFPVRKSTSKYFVLYPETTRRSLVSRVCTFRFKSFAIFPTTVPLFTSSETEYDNCEADQSQRHNNARI